MRQVPEAHAEPDGIVCALSGFVRSESMDICNDPRFFTGNVLDKRMAAFSGLSVCATLFTGNALSECMGMKKDWDLMTVDGLFQFFGFLLMNVVLFSNMLASYVSVAQTYFTYRLMTAGPTGFEIASSFYLNSNIAFWRHAAVKQMLVSLPVFLLGSAFRIFVRIDQEMPGASTATTTPAAPGPGRDSHLGISRVAMITFVLWFAMAVLLFYVNAKHQAVFKERYALAKDVERPLLSHVKMLSERGHSPEF